jgi:hypothetical protein
VPVGVTGHRTQRPRGKVGPPGPHPTQPSSSLDPGGERGPIIRPLAPLIAQLVGGGGLGAGAQRGEARSTTRHPTQDPRPGEAPDWLSEALLSCFYSNAALLCFRSDSSCSRRFAIEL